MQQDSNMKKDKIEAEYSLKRTNSRYIMIRENIYQALDLYTLSLYMTFRYESDYDLEDATIRKSAKYLSEKAKISRRQFFISLNRLEDLGLVLRDSQNQVDSISTYHVAQELNYFNTDCGGVHDIHRGVHGMHTYHYSFSLNNNISENSEKSVTEQTQIEEIVATYHEELPELPKVRKVDRSLKNQLKKMIKDWPDYQKDGEKFSIESFRNYLLFLKAHYGWLLKPYKTESGNEVKSSLRKITRESNITKIVNGEFSATY